MKTNSSIKTTSWKDIVAKYQKPVREKSIWQLCNTLIPYAALWYFMYLSLSISYWLTLALGIVAAGLLVRIFIIFHDCGHESFFTSSRANRFWGFVTGVLTMTPYDYWRHEHAQHHASAGDLDKRGVGDIWTMTVQEYVKASKSLRLRYRLSRHPVILFVIGPAFLFLVAHRFPRLNSGDKRLKGTYLTNAAIVGTGIILSLLMGVKAYLLIQLPVLFMAASAGVWLFYVQHQFEGVYWERQKEWDYVTEALEGSSFYKLPRIFQWFTGSIGYHHIHHLSPRIPNYFLEKCYQENSMFQKVKPVTFLSSLKSIKYRLWDEQNRKLISFGELKRMIKNGLMTA